MKLNFYIKNKGICLVFLIKKKMDNKFTWKREMINLHILNHEKISYKFKGEKSKNAELTQYTQS